ncbi:MAG: hypothetical protein ACRC14_15285, partial [Paracoccaceae bacterium]
MKEIEGLRPTEKPTVMQLVKEAGIDVSDWANLQGGAARASTNPKYCYEWCFESEGISVLNLWFENLSQDEHGIFQVLNPLEHSENQAGPRKRRAQNFYRVAEAVFRYGGELRAIILDRATAGEGSASSRMLDGSIWSVVDCEVNGKLALRRGSHAPEAHFESSDPEALSFPEGEQRSAFMKHRKREGKLRQAKLDDFKHNHGRVFCEVPNCGFDFGKVYGAAGEGFAEVHHLEPLSSAPPAGR